MLETYFDESAPSSKSATSLLLVAGYVGEEERWVEFGHKWAATLDRYGLQRFHMRHIRNLRHPLYRHLTVERRRDLVIELVDLTTQAATLGSLVYLRPEEYEGVTTPEFRSRYGTSYGLLVYLNLLQINGHLMKSGGLPPTTRVFIEQGHANAGDALRVLMNWKFDTDPAPEEFQGTAVEGEPQPGRTSVLRIGDHQLGDKNSLLPLHAADMLAYLANAALAFTIDDFLRDLFDYLLPRVPHISAGYRKVDLEELVVMAESEATKNAAIREGWQNMRQMLYSYGMKMKILPWGVAFDRRHLSDEEWEMARKGIAEELKRRGP